MSVNLLPFVQYCVQKKLNIFHLYVQQDGEPAGEFHWRSDSRRDNIFSGSKSVTSIAAGIAMDEGLLTLDTRVIDILGDHMGSGYDPKWEKVTVKHLLTMSCGHRAELLSGYSSKPEKLARDDLPETDWLKYIFSQPLAYEPGEHFAYNNANPYLLTRMLIKLTGENLIDWCRPRIFEPMGIRNPQWNTDPQGNTIGCGGLSLSAEEYSRFGQLLLEGGVYKGKRIVSEAYVREARAFQIDNSVDGTMNHSDTKLDDGQSGYGYYVWRGSREDTYFLCGWGGQYSIVFPHQNTVATVTSREFDYQTLFQGVWTTLLPEINKSRE